jgi:hypothetical protein
MVEVFLTVAERIRADPASSLVRTGGFARATVCSGCACDGCGIAGKRPSYWLSQRPSPAGIAKASPEAGAVDRGGGREDHASIQKFSASFGAWPRRIVSGALRGSTASC